MELSEEILGTVIDGRYRLAEYIGSGSYGSVYAADEVTLGRVISRVAVKLITPDNPEQRQTVLNEIVGLARLHHDYIIAYRSSGEVAYGDLVGTIFLATELADASLANLIKANERLPDDQLRELFRGVASALAHIHAQGAIHGDVKPANILRVKGRWKLGDLGLMRSATRRRGGPLYGSLSYLAPEMLRHDLRPANDIYALGVTILYVLTGRYAHTGESRAEFTENLRTRPADIPENLPEPWKRLVERCLQADPNYRLTAEQIEHFLRSSSAGAAELPPPPEVVVVTVDPAGGGDHVSLQEAIDQSPAGTRILVRPGKYREPLRIDKALELLAEGAVEEVIVSTRDARCMEVVTDGAVLIRGFTLRCRPGAQGEEYYALDVRAGRPLIEGCVIRSLSLACVAVHGDASPLLRNCSILGSQDAGVFVYEHGRATFDECDIYGHVGSGVTVGDGGRATFRSCQIHDNRGAGAYVFKDGSGRFDECQLFNNAKAGVVIGTGGRGELKRCQVTQNHGEGVLLQDGAMAEVHGCDLTDNARGGWRIGERCRLARAGNKE